MDKESTCIYCGCGCRLKYEVKDNEIIKVAGVQRDDVSEGKPCIKGLTIHEVYDKNRILKPMINGEEVTLQKALAYIHKKTKNLAPNEVFFNTSGKITNEDNYVIEEFARKCYDTHNIDSCCGRLCHNATLMAMKNVYGSPNLTVMKNVDKIDKLLIVGSEPERNYPVFYNKLLRNKIKLIRLNSFTKSNNPNDLVVTIKPGTEACLLNGLINELIKKGFKRELEGWSLLKDTVKKYDVDLVTRTIGVDKKTYKTLVKELSQGRVGIFHGMALTQHLNSLENVHSLLNLNLLLNGVILSLRGEINVQGVGDVHQVSEVKGLNIIEALMQSPVKAAFITEFNPLKSLPDSDQARDKMKKTFIVYFGSYNNLTSKRADVVIPIASLLESEGSITNGERRVRKVNQVLEGPLQLWQVLKQLAKEFNKKINYANSKSITKKIAETIPSYSRVNIENLYRGGDEWVDKKSTQERYMPEEYDGSDDVTSTKYPYLLTTYRSRYAFLTNELTKTSETLRKLASKPGFYLNPEDMKTLSLKDGDYIQVTSTVNSVKGHAYKSDRLPIGIIGAYIHYDKPLVNKLFPLRFDEESYTPNYKSVAVKVEKPKLSQLSV